MLEVMVVELREGPLKVAEAIAHVVVGIEFFEAGGFDGGEKAGVLVVEAGAKVLRCSLETVLLYDLLHVTPVFF